MWKRDIRSFVFNVLFYTLTTMAALLVAITAFMPGARLMRPAILMWIDLVFWLLKVIVGLRIRIIGQEHLPLNRGFILCAKHQSNIDPLIAFKICPHMTAMAKKELFAVPVLGLILRKLGIIGIDRQAGTAHKDTAHIAVSVFKAHRPLLVYPEGTRVKLHDNRPLKKGVFHLQTDVDLPVVTMATNSGLFWMKGSFRKNPGMLEVEISPPMDKGLQKAEFMQDIHNRIIQRSDELMHRARETDPTLPDFTPVSDMVVKNS